MTDDGQGRWWRGLGEAVALVLFLLGLTGCWNEIPVEQRAVITAIGVDGTPGSKALSWSFVLPNVTATASNVSSVSGSQQFFLYRVHATSFNDAQAELAARLSRLPYFGQLEAVAFGESLPTEVVAPILTDINAQTGIPKSFLLTGSEGLASTLASTVLPDEVVPRYWLKSYFSCHICHPLDLAEYGWEWWTDFEAGGHSPVIPVFRLVDHTPRLAGLDVYPDKGTPKRMPDGAADGFALLTGRLESLSVTTSLSGRAVKVERMSARSSVAATETPQGVFVRVRVRATGTFGSPLPSQAPKAFLEESQARVAAVLLADAENAVAFSNQTHTDPFGWNERAGLMDARPLGWPETPPITVRPLTAQISIQVRLAEEGTYGG